MSRPTLKDIAIRNGSDAVVGLIDETTKAHPELTLGEARTIKGLSYKTRVRVAGFDGSTFRDENEGADVGKSKYENRRVETFIMNPRWEVSKSAADSSEDGAEAYIAEEAEAMVEKAMVDICGAFYYGRNTTYGGHAKAFPGLLDSVASTMIVDAGGTTADTGTSIWLIKFGRKDVQWVWGNEGQLDVPESRIETIRDANNKPLDGYVQSLLARPGLQVGSIRSLVRIKKVTADATKGATDALIAEGMSKFEVGVVPDVILMTRRSGLQLQKSRSVTIFTGSGGKPTGSTENVAPAPTSYLNIPIAVTDSIKDTEALTL